MMQILIQKIITDRIAKKFILKWFMWKAKKLFQYLQKLLSKGWKLLLSFYLKKLTPYYVIQGAEKEDYHPLVRLEEDEQRLINIGKKGEKRDPYNE